jgi:hypothetical protein
MTTKNWFLVWTACCVAAGIIAVLKGNFQQSFMLLGSGWICYHAAQLRHE